MKNFLDVALYINTTVLQYKQVTIKLITPWESNAFFPIYIRQSALRSRLS